MPFTPGSYQPLAEDEFPVVIFCTEHEKNKALKLKKDLEMVQDIKPVSIQSSDWKKSRTIVLLLSKYTQSDEGFNFNLYDIMSIRSRINFIIHAIK